SGPTDSETMCDMAYLSRSPYSGWGDSQPFRIKRVAQAFADKIQRQQCDADKSAWPQQQPPSHPHGIEFAQSGSSKISPTGQRFLHADAEEAEKRFGKNRSGHAECGVDDDGPQQVRQQMM